MTTTDNRSEIGKIVPKSLILKCHSSGRKESRKEGPPPYAVDDDPPGEDRHPPDYGLTTSSKCSLAQPMSGSMAGMSDLPTSVSLYSTRGGTSG